MITLYHNPRCSKSRQTLALIEEHNMPVTIIKYLDTPPTKSELNAIIKKLGITPRALLRKTEAEYKSLELKNADLTDAQLIDAMVTHPKLIERPIAIKDTQAVLGRPPENVLALLS